MSSCEKQFPVYIIYCSIVFTSVEQSIIRSDDEKHWKLLDMERECFVKVKIAFATADRLWFTFV